MTEIQKALSVMADEKYAAFQVKLTPGIKAESVIGVRVPFLRDYAKNFAQNDRKCDEFFASLPHKFYDENMLHSILLGSVKPYDKAVALVCEFLPFVDNWAVCDTLKPKIFAKHKAELLQMIEIWIASSRIYTVRFGLKMLMEHFIDGDFETKYLDMASNVRGEDYYIRMMVAWFFATALAKQWDSTIPYIEGKILPEWTHGKTIQKAIESYRITDEQKQYLKTLKGNL